jgi:hypothetical protein
MDLTGLAYDPVVKFCDIGDEFSDSRMHSFYFQQLQCNQVFIETRLYADGPSESFVI